MTKIEKVSSRTTKSWDPSTVAVLLLLLLFNQSVSASFFCLSVEITRWLADSWCPIIHSQSKCLYDLRTLTSFFHLLIVLFQSIASYISIYDLNCTCHWNLLTFFLFLFFALHHDEHFVCSRKYQMCIQIFRTLAQKNKNGVVNSASQDESRHTEAAVRVRASTHGFLSPLFSSPTAYEEDSGLNWRRRWHCVRFNKAWEWPRLNLVIRLMH